MSRSRFHVSKMCAKNFPHKITYEMVLSRLIFYVSKMRAINFFPSSLSSDLKIHFTKKKPIVSESQETNQVPIPAMTTGATLTNVIML